MDIPILSESDRQALLQSAWDRIVELLNEGKGGATLAIFVIIALTL